MSSPCFTPLKIVNADRWSTVQSSKICTITCGKINRLSNFSHPRRGGEGQPRIGTTLKREKSGPSRGRAHKPNRGGMRPNPGAYAPGSYNLKPCLEDANFCFRSLRHPRVEEGKQNSALRRVSKSCLILFQVESKSDSEKSRRLRFSKV